MASPDQHGPIEVCRWRQGITLRGGSKGGACKSLAPFALTIFSDSHG